MKAVIVMIKSKTPMPLGNPKLKDEKTLIKRWIDLFLYSDTHLLEFTVAFHIGFIQNNFNHVPHEPTAQTLTVVGYILGIISCLCIPTKNIGLREKAITALFVFDLTTHVLS